jgi:uncharacterized protein
VPNRLVDETSPYLRQHADNPVDWVPWGSEAFAEAAERDVPVILSVGYSACHWCHVMAHECFEDDGIAGLMNAGFVSVKVDREERPDVDAIYMEATQAATGRGGWPMTVFMFPDGRPFFAGTYFPKEQFAMLLARVSEVWTTQRDALGNDAARLTDAIGAMTKLAPSDGVPGLDALNAGLQRIANGFDADHGGFGQAPKFPQSMNLELLLRAFLSSGGSDGARQIITTSLDAMASGGIYDHIGGGFARYSTDREWLVPHFEKMLYDQATLARLYLHSFQCLGNPTFLQTAGETIDFVVRELKQPEGGFSSAQDADSEGVEGKFYVWQHAEVLALLGPELGPVAAEWYGITPEGNWEGTNIPNRLHARGQLQRTEAIQAARAHMFAARSMRIAPGTDDKVLTEWNALMLGTIAEATAMIAKPDWNEAMIANAEFLVRELKREDGRWMRSWQRDGGARHLALAVDYAALVDAFTRLYEATGQARWMDEAIEAADGMLDLFFDPEKGGLWTTGEDAEELIVRVKDLVDGPSPCANGLAATALLRLAAITGELRYANQADRILEALAPVLEKAPGAVGQALQGVAMKHTGLAEVVVAGDRPDMVEALHRLFLPNAVMAWGERFDSPMWEGREDGLAYVCRNYTCGAPQSTVEGMFEQMGIRIAPAQ